MLKLVVASLLLIAASTVLAVVPIPSLPVDTLSAKHLSLPADLPDLPCLFIVGFTRSSRSETASWSRLLEGRFPADAMTIYSVSVIEDVPALLRRFVIGSIRSGIPKHLHDRFLLVTQHAPDWKLLTSYSESESDSAYILLADRHHQIVWRTQGPASEARVQSLTGQADAVIGGNDRATVPGSSGTAPQQPGFLQVDQQQ